MPIIYFDTETTGLDPNTQDIIEIGAILLDDKFKRDSTKTYHKRLHIQNPTTVSEEALAINHYDSEKWEKEAIPAKEGLLDFNKWLKEVSPDAKPHFAATNAMFDKSFLYSNCDRFQIYPYVDNAWIDIYPIWIIYKYKNNLMHLGNGQEAIADHFDIKNVKAHAALFDAMVGAECMSRLINMMVFHRPAVKTTK